MSTKIPALDPAAAKTFRIELRRYFEQFVEAFDELHSAVTKQFSSPGHYRRQHFDYPSMSSFQTGFPYFHEKTFDRDAPPNYTAAVRPDLASLLSGLGNPKPDLPKGANLASFLRGHKIGERLDLNRPIFEKQFSDHNIDTLVADAVERYLHLYGLESPVDAKRRDAIIEPLICGTVFRKLDLALVIPIAMTHFEVDRFPLTETTYIVRMSPKLQLARARIKAMGSGAVDAVVGAATHAFVSKGWSLEEADGVAGVRNSLRQASPNILEAADSFFGALRVATGINTGYAQMLWLPKRWTLDYYCDLTSVYGTTVRRYPNDYDNYGWARAGSVVTTAHLGEVRRIYRAVVSNQSEGIRLALNRLNSCLTRTDPADAILDGTIGLELLLGDDQNQSLSYKLRLRAAALAILQADPAYPVAEITRKVKSLYDTRSLIVHGRRKKRSKSASEPADTTYAKERQSASDLLRFVLNVLLTHPKYLDPAKIDDGLLLRGESEPQ